jgi:NAD(P) transhydrogenase subunit alpha
VGPEELSESAEAAGGYARSQTEEEEAQTRAIIAQALPKVDLLICTAQVPGRRAPLLVDETALGSMRPGSVVVDLAAETGGNVAGTRAGQRVERNGVVILGPVQLAATVPVHASQMFSRNVLALVEHLADKEGRLRIDPQDEITGALLLTLQGQPRGG